MSDGYMAYYRAQSRGLVAPAASGVKSRAVPYKDADGGNQHSQSRKRPNNTAKASWQPVKKRKQ